MNRLKEWWADFNKEKVKMRKSPEKVYAQLYSYLLFWNSVEEANDILRFVTESEIVYEFAEERGISLYE